MSTTNRHILLSVLLLLTAGHATRAVAEVPTQRPSDEERGQTLWERHCWQCHGATNEGDGPATVDLIANVPSLVGALEVNEETARAILRGKGAMPGFEQSFDLQDARRVLSYQVSLIAGAKPPPTDADAAAKSERAPAPPPSDANGQ